MVRRPDIWSGTMAKGEGNGPSIEEFLGNGLEEFLSKGKSSGGMGQNPSSGAMTRPAVAAEFVSISPPLHRLHETRLVRNAGHMAVGMKMAVPLHFTQNADTVFPQDVVSAATERRTRRCLPRTAILVACAVALGSSTSLTGILATHVSVEVPQPAQGGGAASVDVTGALPQAQPVHALAISIGQTANLTPTVANLSNHLPSGIIRIAQKDAPGLEVSNIFGPAGKPVRVPVSLIGGRAEEYSFLMFRGLPPKVTLSAGFRLKESWAVSLRDLENLTIETPAEFQGAFNLEVLLIKGRDTPAESRVISVEIVSQDAQPPATASINQSAPGPQLLTAAPRTPDAERPPITKRSQQQQARLTMPAAEEQGMMQRAEALLRNKDVASARLLFEHLAKNGSAKAALAMGKTFDPAFFRTIEAAGLKPDVEKARDWYSQAADLGDQEAPSRLSALASR